MRNLLGTQQAGCMREEIWDSWYQYCVCIIVSSVIMVFNALYVFFQESRPTLQSSPTIHVDVDKPDDHHKKSPLGEEFFCYESNEDDNDNDGMYIDGDDVGGDDEQDDEFADVDGNGDENEDWQNGLGLVICTYFQCDSTIGSGLF